MRVAFKRQSLCRWLALLFFLAVVGIYLGWFSPTEAAAIAAFTAGVIGFATRTLSLRGFGAALLETVYSTAMLFFIIVGAFIFSRFIVLTRLPNELVAWVQAVGLAPLFIVAASVRLTLHNFFPVRSSRAAKKASPSLTCSW